MPAFAAAEPVVTEATSAPTENPESLPVDDFDRTETPNWPWLALPVSMISCATRLAWLIGMLKPTPMFPVEESAVPLPAEAIATLTPMISPLLFTSAPPELPGVMAASVWITLIEIEPSLALGWLWPPPGGANWKPWSPPWESSVPSFGAAEEATLMVRFSVETIPSVTVPVRPSGEPIATAVSPTLIFEESPSVAGTKPEVLSTLITARSESGSVPTTLALRTFPSLARTSMEGLDVAPSSVTTWVLVRMWPWSSIMMPDPVPPSFPLVALMVTTLGDALAAAAVMTFTSSLLFTITVLDWPPLEAAGAGLSKSTVLPATTPPPTRPPARMLAMSVPIPNAGLRLVPTEDCWPGALWRLGFPGLVPPPQNGWGGGG